MPTETQAECFDRLKCKPDEELEECKKRLREGGDADRDDADRDDADRDRDDADRDRDDDDRDRDRDRGDRDRDRDRGDRDRGDRDRGDRDRGDRDDDDRDRDDDEGYQETGRFDDDDVLGEGGHGRHGRSVVRPGTHPGFFSGGLGASFIVCYRSDCHVNGGLTQFYGTLDFGWHLMGKGFKGPAIGANIHGGYGRVAGWDVGRFGGAFKFWWDIQMTRDVGFYLTPFVQAGPTSFFFEADRFCRYDPTLGRTVCPPDATDSEHFFNLQHGMMLRLILGDRGMVYFQPMTFDHIFNGDGAGLLYHFEIGGGVIFG